MKQKTLNRRVFLAGTAGGFGTIALAAPGTVYQSRDQAAEDLEWYNVKDWGVEGRGWPTGQLERYFDRLPARAHGVVREEVWNLSRDSAGMVARFRSDATEMRVKYVLFRERLAMPHMPATGVSGLDLYAVGPAGRLRWVSVVRPATQEVEENLAMGLDPGFREYRIYLPLYNGVDSLEIGVPKSARFEGIEPRLDKPLIFYGTSITHGACASRPGMAHPAILGRRLELPVINLGFSGNGRMEVEVGKFLTELDPSVYIIDCLPNLTGDLVKERAAPLVRQLRAARPETPIVLVEDRTYTNAWIKEASRQRHDHSRKELRAAYEALLAEGHRDLFYLGGAALLGDDGDAATDGSHPSDLGFVRQADAFEPALREALKRT